MATTLMLLYVFIDNDKKFLGDVYFVKVSSDIYVGELNEELFRRHKTFLEKRGVDAAVQITLFQLVPPLPIPETQAGRTAFLQMIEAFEFPSWKSVEASLGDRTVRCLYSSKSLWDYWQESPQKECLHLIVQLPPRLEDASRAVKWKHNDSKKAQALAQLDTFIKDPPSVVGKADKFQSYVDLVRCNRPFDYDTLPIDLLEQEFAIFMDDCTLEPSSEATRLLEELTEAACQWYPNEEERRDAINKAFCSTTGLSLSPRVIEGTTRVTDGNSEAVVIPALIRECENNDGFGLFKSIAYHAHFLHDRLDFEPYTKYPCILMADVGSQIGFYGCIWTGMSFVVQPLTPIYDLTVHWANMISRRQIAVSLTAVLKTVARIDKHYRNVQLMQRQVQHGYPFPESFLDGTGSWTSFIYESQINSRLVFNVVSETGDRFIIKFTKQYSEVAHRFLAGLGYAPALRAVNDIYGGWKMVVMEYSRYTSLRNSSLRLDYKKRVAVKVKIQSVIKQLHAQDLVHGDIRQANILVDKETLGDSAAKISVHIIDFDWAGRVGEVKYPLMINTRTIRRPADVAGEILITKAHDLEMIKLLFY